MPRLCQRMRHRRGSSRGQILHPPSSSLSNSSSPLPAQFTGRYSATQSGRGRVRIASTQLDDVAPQSPATFASSPHPNQSTQFQFQCTLDCPCIIATISVAFREESPNSKEFDHSDMKKKGLAKETNIASKQGSLGTIRGRT